MLKLVLFHIKVIMIPFPRNSSVYYLTRRTHCTILFGIIAIKEFTALLPLYVLLLINEIHPQLGSDNCE